MRDDSLPQFQQIQSALAAQIAQGLLVADSRLPGERELAERFGCTRVTLREALMRLEIEGLIYRENRRGWFISPPRIRYDPTRTQGFMEYVAAQGRTPRTETLSACLRPAGPRDALRLQLGASAPVFELTRRRWVDRRAVLVEINVIDASWCPELLAQDLDTSLTWLLKERFGLHQTRCSVALHSTILPASAAEALNAMPGSPTLCIERQCLAMRRAPDGSAEERPVEFDQEFWHPRALLVALDAVLPVSAAGGGGGEKAVASSLADTVCGTAATASPVDDLP